MLGSTAPRRGSEPVKRGVDLALRLLERDRRLRRPVSAALTLSAHVRTSSAERASRREAPRLD
jgi:hypothetical protein